MTTESEAEKISLEIERDARRYPVKLGAALHPGMERVWKPF